MPDFPQLHLDNQLCHVIYSAANALARFYKPVLEPLGLTYPQYLIMMALWTQDGVNILHISKATYFDSGTLTPLLKKLQEKEYLEIAVDKNDLRNRIVRLTKRGKNLKNKASEIPETLSCLLPFKQEEFEKLKSLTTRLHQAIVANEQERKSD